MPVKVTLLMKTWNDPTVITDILPQAVSCKPTIKMFVFTKMLIFDFPATIVNWEIVKICKNDSTYPSCTCLWSKRRIDSFSKVVYSHRLKIFSCSHLLLKMCTNHRWWNWTSRTKSLRQNFHLRSHNESYKKCDFDKRFAGQSQCFPENHDFHFLCLNNLFLFEGQICETFICLEYRI